MRLSTDDCHRSPSQNFLRKDFHIHKIRLVLEIRTSMRSDNPVKFFSGFRQNFWECTTC